MASQGGTVIERIILAAAALFGALVGSIVGYLWSRWMLRTQTLHYLLTEYRSVEMFEAVKALHAFMEESPCGGESPRCRYEARVRDDNKRLQAAPDCEKSDILKHSIENQRRTVSQYYFIMLRALEDRIVRPKGLFEYWSSGALEIIHKAIQPLGQDDDKGLQRLYQKVLTYEKRKAH